MLFAPTPVALYTSEVCLKHEPGWFNPERPERLSGLLEAMRTEWSSEFAGLLSIHEPESDATPEQLLRVHTPAHLARLDDAFGRVGGILTPRVNLDADTIVSAGTQAAARRAAGLVVAAVDEVFGASPSGVSRAFVMVRPPGHHAEPDRAMGFCLYNNVMVGAAHAQAAAHLALHRSCTHTPRALAYNGLPPPNDSYLNIGGGARRRRTAWGASPSSTSTCITATAAPPPAGPTRRASTPRHTRRGSSPQVRMGTPSGGGGQGKG